MIGPEIAGPVGAATKGKTTEAHVEAMWDNVRAAFMLPMINLAYRTGLFAAMAHAGPLTIAQVAERSKLQPRYVEEVLSALAGSGILLYDREKDTFQLEDSAVPVYCDANSPVFMAEWYGAMVPCYAAVPGVAKAMREGGGVPFSDFGPEFVEALDKMSAPGLRGFLVQQWLPRIPGLVERLQQGIRVLEVGCGSGTACLVMGRAFPNSTFLGIDIDQTSIDRARAKQNTPEFRDVRNVTFECRPTATLTQGQYDFVITVDVIHDCAKPVDVLNDIRAALAPNGIYLMMEPNCEAGRAKNIGPMSSMLYSVSTLHCMTQSLARGGEGLGACWGPEKAEDYARRAGFGYFQRHMIKSDEYNFYEIRHTK